MPENENLDSVIGFVPMDAEDCKKELEENKHDYLATKVGSKIEGTVVAFGKRITTPEKAVRYPMKIGKGKDEKYLDFDYVLLLDGDRIASFNSWKVVGQLKEAFANLGMVEGAKINMAHTRNGNEEDSGWDVEVKK